MPGIAQRIDNKYADGAAALFNGSVSTTSFWSKHCDDVSYNQLQKFWSALSSQARHKLLRIDKQTLFEQARKNMYCSRCNGLLLEGYYQIVMYGKSLQAEGVGVHRPCKNLGSLKNQGEDDVQAPSIHPWGGLTTTRDGALTLLDCYIYAKSLKGLQNVFDSARARERERELLYPDACGGGGRGWISQGVTGYGRGHGTRETCALHTARLSVDTLVDFWLALGEETRQSLLRMKEEDFIERLMYRFDSKRFCRDCRRNVIREFKELKELKRLKRETHCTSWFCVADATIQFEVSQNTIRADWHHAFIETLGTYHHFEWAVGTGEGKSDILEFEDVGLSGRVQVNGLDLSGLSACFITLRAWKMDGRCSELSVKAHALKGQECVHCRLVVGDGFVTITRGEDIRRFFEHAEEAEEEEDDDGMDKDGNDLDGECTRPQKHAKSPELAREFLLDAATVMFKEQVEKAFREGTARQNAHSIFVSLALKLLEEQVHVACKEIITLEKQNKLLEEEEKEKRDEEERKERRRLKEKEKKLRRKERLREKEKDREKKSNVSNQNDEEVPKEELKHCVNEESNDIDSQHCVSEMEEPIPSSPSCLDIQDNTVLNGYSPSYMQVCPDGFTDEDVANTTDENESFALDQLKYRKEFEPDSGLKWSDRQQFVLVSENGGTTNKYEGRHHGDNSEIPRCNNRLNKQLRINTPKSNVRIGGPKFADKFHSPINRLNGRYDSHACNCNTQTEYRVKTDPCMPRWTQETKPMSKSELASDPSKTYSRISKYSRPEYTHENFARSKSKITIWSNTSNRDSPVTKKVWEPMDSQKYPRSNSVSNLTLRSTLQTESSATNSSDEVSEISVKMISVKEVADEEDDDLCRRNLSSSIHGTSNLSMSSSSNSDNCSSCLSEGDSNTSSSNLLNPESSSSTSDSEDSSQISEVRETNLCIHNGFNEVSPQKEESIERDQDLKGTESLVNRPSTLAPSSNSSRLKGNLGIQPPAVLPQVHNQNVQFPVFQHPTMGYYYQSPVSLAAAAPANGLMSFPHSGQYLYTNPFSYGLNGSAAYMRYGALHQMSQSPLYNPGCLPVLHPAVQTKVVNSKENDKNDLGGAKRNHHEDSVERTTTPNGTTGQSGKFDKPDGENLGFSLFAFSDPTSVKEGNVGNFGQNFPMNHRNGDHGCNKEAPVEEYNPFSNGIKFSFADIVS